MDRLLASLVIAGCSKPVGVIETLDPSFASIIAVTEGPEIRAEAFDREALAEGHPILIDGEKLELFLYADPLELLQVPRTELAYDSLGRTLPLADLVLGFDAELEDFAPIRPTMAPPPLDLPPFDPEACALAGGCTKDGPACDMPCTEPRSPAPPEEPIAPEPPEPPDLRPCPSGWLEAPAAGVVTCRPPPLPEDLDCPPGRAQLAMTSTCVALGRACALGPPAADVFVPPGAGTIAAAIAANPGATSFALDQGRYVELAVDLRSDPAQRSEITLLGTCPEGTVIEGPILARSPRVTIRDLTVVGAPISQDVDGHAILEGVAVLDAPNGGIFFTRGTGSLSRILIVRATGAGASLAGSAVDANELVIEQASGIGLALAAGSTLTGSSIAVRNTIPDAANESNALILAGRADLESVELAEFRTRGLQAVSASVTVRGLRMATASARDGVESISSTLDLDVVGIEGPTNAVRAMDSRIAATDASFDAEVGITASATDVILERSTLAVSDLGVHVSAGGSVVASHSVAHGARRFGFAAPNPRAFDLDHVVAQGDFGNFAITSFGADRIAIQDTRVFGSGGGVQLGSPSMIVSRLESDGLEPPHIHCTGPAELADIAVVNGPTARENGPTYVAFEEGSSSLERVALGPTSIAALGRSVVLTLSDVRAGGAPVATPVLLIDGGAAARGQRISVSGVTGVELDGGGEIAIDDLRIGASERALAIGGVAFEATHVSVDGAEVWIADGDALDRPDQSVTIFDLDVRSTGPEPAVQIERQAIVEGFRVETSSVGVEIAALPRLTSFGNGRIVGATCGVRIGPAADSLSSFAGSLRLIVFEGVEHPYCP